MPEITVRYKRLETIGSYCNVEIEAQAIVSADLTQQEIENAMLPIRTAIDNEIWLAKQRKRDEEKAEAERWRRECE